MISSNDQHIYRELMQEVKRRTEVINSFRSDPSRALYNWTWAEFLSLQLRMILESIALGCLVANQSDWPRSPGELQKAWHAGRILSELERVQPESYPTPLIEIPPDTGLGDSPMQGRFRGELVDRPPGDWLTRDGFMEVYGRLGNVLHARNPLAPLPEFRHYESNIPIWQEKIMNLLNHHKIGIRGSGRMYVVQMNAFGEGHTPGDVQVTEFVKLD